MPTKTVIKNAESYALSDADIKKVLGDDISIIVYPDLKYYTKIEDIFDDKGRCIMLFPNSTPTSGHWCGLLLKKDGIEFFNPYGKPPKITKTDGVDSMLAKQLDVENPYLEKLLKESGLPVYYNTERFQKISDNIATCGRWAAIRMLLFKYPLTRFKKIIKESGLNGDEYVTAVIYNRIHK